jgi:hypothetical protein
MDSFVASVAKVLSTPAPQLPRKPPEGRDDPSRIPRRSWPSACAACRRRDRRPAGRLCQPLRRGLAEGRSEAEIAAALGDPARLARELRAEAGLRRWETARTPANFYAALVGFLALIAVDFMFLLPLLGALALVALLVGVAMLVPVRRRRSR